MRRSRNRRGVVFVCVECMYGGLHALAWTLDSMTACEQSLRRFAVVFGVFFELAVMSLFMVSKT